MGSGEGVSCLDDFREHSGLGGLAGPGQVVAPSPQTSFRALERGVRRWIKAEVPEGPRPLWATVPMGAARAKAPAAPDPAFLKSEIFTTPFFQSFISVFLHNTSY